MAAPTIFDEVDLREIAWGLTPPMKGVILRCSDAVDWCVRAKDRSFSRDWADVVAGVERATFRHTVGALIRRKLAGVTEKGEVYLTLRGLAVRERLVREGWRP